MLGQDLGDPFGTWSITTLWGNWQLSNNRVFLIIVTSLPPYISNYSNTAVWGNWQLSNQAFVPRFKAPPWWVRGMCVSMCSQWKKSGNRYFKNSWSVKISSRSNWYMISSNTYPQLATKWSSLWSKVQGTLWWVRWVFSIWSQWRKHDMSPIWMSSHELRMSELVGLG